MSYVMLLPGALKQAGWKVKIHDSERLEPPHVTIYQRMRKWRLSLRDGSFLDRVNSWSEIDERVRMAIEREWKTLIAEWDEIHPDNPVFGEEDE